MGFLHGLAFLLRFGFIVPRGSQQGTAHRIRHVSQVGEKALGGHELRLGEVIGEVM